MFDEHFLLSFSYFSQNQFYFINFPLTYGHFKLDFCVVGELNLKYFLSLVKCQKFVILKFL